MNNKLYSYFYVLFILVLIPVTNAQSIEEYISKVDNEAEKNFNNQKALELLLEADKKFPNNWEVQWRLSRTLVDITEHLPNTNGKEEEVQIEKYNKALEYADNAIKLAPDKSITYLRKAIVNGRIALFKGVFSVAGVVNQVKEDVEKAISLGNGGKNVQATSHYVLGRTHAKLAEKPGIVRWPLGLGWGDIEVGIEEYKKAIKLRPDFRMFYVDLAKAYIEEDEYELAREMLKKVATCPEQDEDDKKLLAESKTLLKEIADK